MSPTGAPSSVPSGTCRRSSWAAPSTKTSDLYALGATLVHLATRRPPSTMMTPDLRLDFERYARVSPKTCQFLRKLVMKEPSARFRSATEALKFLNRRHVDRGRLLKIGGVMVAVALGVVVLPMLRGASRTTALDERAINAPGTKREAELDNPGTKSEIELDDPGTKLDAGLHLRGSFRLGEQTFGRLDVGAHVQTQPHSHRHVTLSLKYGEPEETYATPPEFVLRDSRGSTFPAIHTFEPEDNADGTWTRRIRYRVGPADTDLYLEVRTLVKTVTIAIDLDALSVGVPGDGHVYRPPSPARVGTNIDASGALLTGAGRVGGEFDYHGTTFPSLSVSGRAKWRPNLRTHLTLTYTFEQPQKNHRVVSDLPDIELRNRKGRVFFPLGPSEVTVNPDGGLSKKVRYEVFRSDMQFEIDVLGAFALVIVDLEDMTIAASQ